jgi:hypothetical protein
MQEAKALPILRSCQWTSQESPGQCDEDHTRKVPDLPQIHRQIETTAALQD